MQPGPGRGWNPIRGRLYPSGHEPLQQTPAARCRSGRPIRVALIGAGKFGSMYLAQIPRTPGVHLLGIADLAPDAARANLARVGWEPQRTRAGFAGRCTASTAARTSARTGAALVSHPAVDVVVECTGHPVAAVEHCLSAFAQRQARRQRHGGGRCAMRAAAGTARGRGGRRLFAGLRRPAGAHLRSGRLGADAAASRWWRPGAATSGCRTSAQSTPETVWGYYGLTPRAGGTRRAEPEDVQQLPRRQQAGDRELRGQQCDVLGRAGRRPALPAGQHRRHSRS
jgi:hypothetical protein